MGCISDGMLDSRLSVGTDSVTDTSSVSVVMLVSMLADGTDSVSVGMLLSLCSPSDGVTYGRLDCCMDG